MKKQFLPNGINHNAKEQLLFLVEKLSDHNTISMIQPALRLAVFMDEPRSVEGVFTLEDGTVLLGQVIYDRLYQKRTGMLGPMVSIFSTPDGELHVVAEE